MFLSLRGHDTRLEDVMFLMEPEGNPHYINTYLKRFLAFPPLDSFDKKEIIGSAWHDAVQCFTRHCSLDRSNYQRDKTLSWTSYLPAFAILSRKVWMCIYSLSGV